MGYRIADEERLIEAIQAALSRNARFESQRAFGDAVRRVLQAEDGALRASDQRIRRTALRHGLVQVHVETGRTKEPARDACPVCGSALEAVKNQTLDGQETVVGVRCPGCPYTSGAKHEVPVRYAFARANGASVEARGPF